MNFDAITFEAQFDDETWTDITPDVRSEPRPAWGRGILANGPLDRVGMPQTLKLCLKNGTDNSAGLAGYYSPGHANARSGFDAGLKVRLSFTFEGEAFYKFYGKVAPRGIRPIPGIYGPRYTEVLVWDFMAQATNHDLALMEYAENKRMDEVIALILAAMPIQPLATVLHEGVSTFPTVFDTVRAETRAIGEFQKLALSEFGQIYVRGDRTGGETLVAEGREHRSYITERESLPLIAAESAPLLAEDGEPLLAEDGEPLLANEVEEAAFTGVDIRAGMTPSYGQHLSNRIKATSYPRRVDAAATTVLFTLQKVISLAPGEVKSGIQGSYRDPAGGASKVNGRDMVTPVEGTDYTANSASDGSGSNLTANLSVTATYGTEGVDYTLENTGEVLLHITLLQARGRGIYIYDSARLLVQDAVSLATHGTHLLQFDMKYQDNPLVVEAFSRYTLGLEREPRLTLDGVPLTANRDARNMYGFLYGEPGARYGFSEELTAPANDYFIQGYSAEIAPGGVVNWTPVLKAASQTSFWIWDLSGWDIDTTWGFPEE